MIKDVLENLDSEVLTDEMKSTISEAFEKAIEEKLDESFDVKVAEKAIELVEAKDAEYKIILEETEAKHIAEAQEFKETLVNTIDVYLSEFVSEMVAESIDEMKNDIAVAKSKAIIEAFEKLGLEIKTEQVDENIQERASEVEELKAELNKVINENIELKAGILAGKKEAIAESAFATLTEIQKDKAKALVEALGDIRDVEEFAKKVEIVVESVSEAVAPQVIEEAKIEEVAQVKSTFKMSKYL